MISVIVPAHNEEPVIARALGAMSKGARPDEIEIIVVCNGCTDETAAVARDIGGPVRVIETSTPSKSNALNLGDEAASGYPRFYVDADVIMPIEALRQVAALLETGEVLAAAPRLEVSLDDRSWAVRAFYRAWVSLPYFDEQMIGSGVYAMSEEGRKRFTVFPDIIADDGYARLLFEPDERRAVMSCSFVITPPMTLAGVVHIMTRVRAGHYELRRVFPTMWRNETGSPLRSLLAMLRHPGLWLAYPVYLYVTAVAKWRGRRKLVTGRTKEWERDESSRSRRIDLQTIRQGDASPSDRRSDS